MTTSPPQMNGHARPLPVIRDWQTLYSVTPAAEPVQTDPTPPVVDLVAQAEADAIRTRAYAEAEEQRIRAEANAEAAKIKAVEEARKLKLANDKAEARAAEEQAARDARIAESNRKREEAERDQVKARQAEAQQQEAEATSAREQRNADDSWKYFAVAFAFACAVVALPVQLSAFWHPDRPWMISAPFMLEAGAWVVLRGAAAAVVAHRPHWHFRLIAWLLAFISAGINLWHGLAAFDTATAIGTAFASLAGPGVWDLHEHGRIRKRDGVLTRRERKAAERAAKAEAKRKAAEEAARTAEKEAAAAAAAESADMLADARAEEFPEVWDEAEKIAAAVGEVTVTEAVWARAYRNIQGCEPGESIESITARRAAERRIKAALTGTPVSTLSKTTNAQRGAHLPPAPNKPRLKPVPPRRTRGDSTPFHPAARRLAADTARRSTTVRINAEEN